MAEPGKLWGLCGRAGAGKSTTADIMVDAKEAITLYHYNNPWAYIMSTLYEWDYGLTSHVIPATSNPESVRAALTEYEGNFMQQIKDPILNKTMLQGFEWTLNTLKLLHQQVPEKLSTDFYAPNPRQTPTGGGAVQISFAETLKMICVPIATALFDLPGGRIHGILLGETPDDRSMREQHHDTLMGQISGREILERVGTNCFRKQRDDFWITIASRRIQRLLDRGRDVVIPDVRFENEARSVRALGGKLIVLARSPIDLILTEADKTTHVSKWEFLTFIRTKKDRNNDEDIIIINDGTLVDLKRIILQITGLQIRGSDSLR